MARDNAFQRALELSVKFQTEAIVFRSELSEYGAILLDQYKGYSSDICATFSSGVRLD